MNDGVRLYDAGDTRPVSFETPRLTVRRFRETDLDAFAAYRNDPEWMRWQGFKGLDKAAYRAALLGAHSLADGLQLAVVRREDGVLLGDLYLKREEDALTLGYTVAPAYARNGYASEAVSGALAWARANGFRVARAAVTPGNAPSAALLNKLRFVGAGRDEEGDDVYEKPLSERG